MSDPQEREGFESGRVFAGVVIILVGAAMLVDRTGFADIHLSTRFWPLILIALGLVRMSDAPRMGRHGPRARGTWLLWIGAWGLVSEFHVLGLDYNSSWPLLIIGAGLGLVWAALARPCATRSIERS